jgi:hypothetical protein
LYTAQARNCTDHRTDEFGGEVGHGVGEVDGDAVGIFALLAEQDAECHGRVEVRAGLERDEDTGEDAEAPTEGDQQPAAAVAFGLGQDDVGNDADAEQHEHRCTGDLIEEDGAHISQTPIVCHFRWVFRPMVDPEGAPRSVDIRVVGIPLWSRTSLCTVQWRVSPTRAAAEASSSVDSAAT